ncbi:uncharacterized protein Mis12 isoform X2 [Anabrus simplex]|uniref:uncharacterized protein Mis12 isoform X2 n=1 Tax=Anabrus simplex TaxID=316456 RepID=UPI0035A3018D
MGSKIPTLEDLRKREYEVQVLDHSVQDIADGVKSIVHDNIITAMNMLQGVLSKKDKHNVEKIKRATASLLQEYEVAATNKHGEIEALVQKTFAIPDHVILPEDAAQSRQYTQDEVDKIDEEIENLKKKAKRMLLPFHKSKET